MKSHHFSKSLNIAQEPLIKQKIMELNTTYKKFANNKLNENIK